MNITTDVTQPQEDALQALRRRHNRDNNVSLTLRQYLEGQLSNHITHLLSVAATYVGAAEVKEAYDKASGSVKSQVNSLLGL